jgi:hypothetical protein
MSQSPVGMARSTIVNRVSEMTLVNDIRQGFTAPLVVRRQGGTIVGIGYDQSPAAVPARYVDNLRLALAIIASVIAGGGNTVLDDIATIHFARWVVLPGDRQLLFTSNFDGGWEQYIHDFTTIANIGEPTPDNKLGVAWLDLIWGNCVAYPGTTDFPGFLEWVQTNMVQTTLFFPTISDVTVRDEAWLREFRRHFATFDEIALAVDRRLWPAELLHAYDELKASLNRIDVTDV